NRDENGFSSVKGRVIMIEVYDGRVCDVKEIEEFKKGLRPHTLADTEGFCDAQIHVHETRPGERVARRFQVPAIEGSVAVQIDRCKSALGIGEPALRAKKAAELDLPGKFN